MPSWMKIPGRTHEAALAGKVVDAQTHRPISGVAVSMVQVPAAFAAWLSTRALQHGAAWERLADRPDRVHTAADGCFHFVDLPDGEYVLSFALEQATHRYGPLRKSFTVARDAQGRFQAPIHELPLPPTAVRGQVKGLVQGQATALPLARVRVEDSGELAYGDVEGRFYLTGVEPGERVLRFSAAGFQPATAPVSITAGLITALDPPVVLQPTTP